MFKIKSLTPLQYQVIVNKATEYPYTGEFTDTDLAGSYLCRSCGSVLFRSNNKFHSGCGWASFDNEVFGAINHVQDSDGIRTEILCNNCNAHLGHIFHGENFTELNKRYCVNSASLDFVNDVNVLQTEEIIIAGGCFWGVEYYLQRLEGVIYTGVGYCGGYLNDPTYADVCKHNTGHLEVVRVIWDSSKQNLANILKLFFEIHDPTQVNGQGPDIGSQYLSAIFCYDDNQKVLASTLIEELFYKGFNVVTQIRDVMPFWLAEEYHRSYYNKNKSIPYCHSYCKRF